MLKSISEFSNNLCNNTLKNDMIVLSAGMIVLSILLSLSFLVYGADSSEYASHLRLTCAGAGALCAFGIISFFEKTFKAKKQ